MAESRFERWSRRKSEARTEEQVAEQALVEAGDELSEELSDEERELAINESLSDEELLAKYELPDPDVSELGMDIKGFMRNEIPEALRRRALRSLWRSNPVLAVLDGLNDYDEDFNTVTTGAEGVKTLYQVGKGMFDKAKRAEEKLQELAAESENAIQSFEPDVSIPVKRQADDEEREFETLPTSEVQSNHNSAEGEVELPVGQLAELEEPQASVIRYRPRMSFS